MSEVSHTQRHGTLRYTRQNCSDRWSQPKIDYRRTIARQFIDYLFICEFAFPTEYMIMFMCLDDVFMCLDDVFGCCVWMMCLCVWMMCLCVWMMCLDDVFG